MILDLSGSWCIKGTGDSMTGVDSSVLLMHHDPDRSRITDPGHPQRNVLLDSCDLAFVFLVFYRSTRRVTVITKTTYLNPRFDDV